MRTLIVLLALVGCASAGPRRVAHPKLAARKLKDAAPTQTTGLLSAPIAPGASGHTGVTLPVATAPSSVTPSDPQRWTSLTYTWGPTADGAGVWLDVAFTNSGADAARFTADVAYGPDGSSPP